MRNWKYLAKAFTVACLAMPLAGFAAERLQVSVRQSAADAREGLPYVTVTIVNQSDSPVWIFPPGTPLVLVDGHAMGRWFEFAKGDIGEPRFVGRYVLMRQPDPSSYVKLNPGDTREAMVDLSADYSFLVEGSYSVRTTVASYGHIPTGDIDSAGDSHDTGDLQRFASEYAVLKVSPAFIKAVAPLADNEVPCTDEQLAQTWHS